MPSCLLSISPISTWGSSSTLYTSGLVGGSTTSSKNAEHDLGETLGSPWPSDQFRDEHVTPSHSSASEHSGGSYFPLRIATGRPSGWSCSSHLPQHRIREQRQCAKEGGANPGDGRRQGPDNIVRIQSCLKSALCRSCEPVNALCTYT